MLKNILTDISVRSKLTLGFSILVVLALCIALTGWVGIASVSERSERIANIGELSALSRDTRIGRLAYTIDYDDQHEKNWLDSIETLQKHLQHLKTVLNSPANLQQVNFASLALADYIANYKLFIKATNDREQMRTIFAKEGQLSFAKAEKLEWVSNSSVGTPEERETASRMIKLIQTMRFDVRGYSYNLKSESLDRARASVTLAIGFAKSLPVSFGEGELSDGLNQNLMSYRRGFEDFITAQARINEAQDNIIKSIEKLLSASHNLTKNQVSLRIKDLNDARTYLLSSLVLAFCVSIFAARTITRLIVPPLKKVLSALEKVASGDFSQPYRSDRKDELGLLANSVETMTISLRYLVGGVRDGVTRIANSAGQLSAITEQTSAGVTSQRNETDQVATAMNEMAATVHEVAHSAEQASAAAVNASLKARQGSDIVSEAAHLIENLAAEVSNSKSAMDDLTIESNKIGGVLDVIKAVAEQTNLLALNAAIEAARAGDAGKGFAVVSEEVRSLAQRTQISTEEIAKLIESLHIRTSEVSHKLDSSLKLSNASVELTRTAGHTINDINQSVATIEAMNHQIAAAAEEQSVVAEQISRSVVNVREVSEKTASASAETAASSAELAGLGAHMQSLISKFKL